MQYTSFETEEYAGASVEKKNTPLFYCVVSVDIHTAHTASCEALELMYEEAILSGAGTMSREAFTDALSKFGATITVSITHSVITFTIKSTDQHATKVLNLFTTMLQKPTFAKKELARIRKQIHNELIEYSENARGQALDHLVNALYVKDDRRYTENAVTLQKEIQKINTATLRTFHANVLATRATVTIGGTEKAIKRTKEITARCFKPSKVTKVAKKHKAHNVKKTVTLHAIPSKQNIEFSIGSVLPITLHHPDYLPFLFGLQVLGKWGGFTGRLMSTVREKEGLTYGIYARTETVSGNEVGYWRIMTFFAPEKSTEGLSSTLREIKAIRAKGITDDEYKRFKTILHTQQVMLTDSFVSSIEELHGYLKAGFSLDEMKQYKLALLSVTKEDVNRAMKKYLNTEHLVISGAGPTQTVQKELTKVL